MTLVRTAGVLTLVVGVTAIVLMRRHERQESLPRSARVERAADRVEELQSAHGTAGIPLFPEQASTMAARVDHLYFFITAVCTFFAMPVTVLVIVLRDQVPAAQGGRSRASRFTGRSRSSWHGLAFRSCWRWSCSSGVSSVYFALARVPDEAMDVYAVGKQWMWKFQHREGPREINELHVPVDTPVRVLITSEDVLHSLYFPGFRTKMDAVPGRYTQLWFTATKPGTYHIFCAEYCGARHSAMIGRVVVMPQQDFQAWVGGGGTEGTLAQSRREALHRSGVRRPATARAPVSAGRS